MPNLYEDLGGAGAIDAAVDLFYRKVLNDKRVNGFFQGVDMERQIEKQKSFLTMAFGGPKNYRGRDMRSAHRRSVQQGLNDSHFNAVVELLGDTLRELGVSPVLIARVAEVAESVRDEVLNRQPAVVG